MPKSEHRIQDEIREAVCRETEYVVFRTNAGTAYQGTKIYSPEYGQYILKDLRPYKGLPKGFSDLLCIGPNGKAAFLEVKDEKGRTRPEQEKFLAAMARMGHRVAVVRSAEDAVKALKGGLPHD